MLNKDFLKKRIAPLLLCGSMLGTMVGCSYQDKENTNSENSSLSDNINSNPLKVMEDAEFKIEKKDITEGYTIYKLLNNKLDYFYNISGPEEDGTNLFVNYFPYEFEETCTVSEFSKYTGEDNLTWDDVKKSLKENKNIDEDLKNIISEGIDELAKKGLKINLNALNYNIKNLKVEYIKKDESKYMNVVAKFEANVQTVFIDPKQKNDPLFKRIVLHEVLGHGSNMAYINESGGIFCTSNIGTALVDGDILTGSLTLGISFDEAYAEYISIMASNKKTNSEETMYPMSLYILLILCRVANISVEDYCNNGVEYLIDKLKEIDLIYPIPCIEQSDINFLYTQNGLNTAYDYNEIIINSLKWYIYLCKDRGYTEDEVLKEIDSIIDCYKDYIEPFKYEGYDTIVSYSTYSNIAIVAMDLLKEHLIEYAYNLYSENKAK